jgi:hypothetical protein
MLRRADSNSWTQGVTKRCRLSWLTSSAHVSLNAGGARELRGLSHYYSFTHKAQINFGDRTPYLTYDWTILRSEFELYFLIKETELA